jgi:histidinol-phosphate aminotransferase
MAGYLPGEQPQDGAFIKLNTNENPYPPSPRVFEALQNVLAGHRLRKYPDPVGNAFRATAARLHNLDPDAILIGNGSDDILTLVTRAFVPQGGLVAAPMPGYVLYRSLAEIQGARFQPVSYTPDWQLPDPWPCPNANLTFVASPNSPSGTTVSVPSLEHLLEQLQGPLVLDEAYVDFAEANGVELIRNHPVIVSRSLSKSYSLAGIRFGYAMADPSVIHELLKVKDSYNCDVLSQAAAQAALEDQISLSVTRERILATRARLANSLAELGFDVCPSQANFLWCRRADRPVQPIYAELKRRKILVRYMCYEGYGDGLRISVGSDQEIDRLLEELTRIV